MPDYLALDWESHELSGFDATVGKGSVRVRKSFSLTWPTDAELAPESNAGGKTRLPADERSRLLGEWLRRELAALRISTRQVLVSLPREETVVRQLEVPDVPEGELANIVRLQAETRVSSSLEKLLLDFLPLPRQPGAVTREVLMATVSRSFSDRMGQVLQAAGLELVSMGLSSVATAEIVARAEALRGMPPHDTSLALVRNGQRLELSLVRDRSLLFTHAAQLNGETEAELIQSALAEVSRSSVALERALAGSKLTRAWAIGPTDTERAATSRSLSDSGGWALGAGGSMEQICRALKKRLGCDVYPLQPLTELGVRTDEPDPEANRSWFSGPLGMLLAQSGALVPQLDFLNPRKSASRIDPRKLRLGMMAAAVALFALVGVGWSLVRQHSLNNTLEARKRESAALAAKITAGKTTLDAENAIAMRLRSGLNLLDQSGRLNEAFPGTRRIILKKLHYQESRLKDGLLHVTAQGYARERADIEYLKQKLSEMGYVVKPTPDTRSQKMPNYTFEFQLELDVKKAPPAGAKKPASVQKKT